MILTKLYREFFNSEKAGGLILIIMTVFSLLLANSAMGSTYIEFWQKDLGGHSIIHWINDALMAIFFLLIGLELERELYQGELTNFREASLPVFAAAGGMLVPAAIYLSLNFGSATQSGAGIPMATDIAFALGILSLLGNRVPASLKIFLTALAVIDDLGAIIIIAVFYGDSLSMMNLSLALGVLAVLIVLNRLRICNLIPYLAGGVLMWYFMSKSGIHATISGVLLAFVIPFGKGNENSPSYLLQHFLHKPVAFFIIPLFALANTCLPVDSSLITRLGENYSIGIMLGLFVGKPLGIILFTFMAVKAGLGSLPEEISWKSILGAGFLAGIGFTMSIFITLLAFNDPAVVDTSKMAILSGSLISALTGLLILHYSLPRKAADSD